MVEKAGRGERVSPSKRNVWKDGLIIDVSLTSLRSRISTGVTGASSIARHRKPEEAEAIFKRLSDEIQLSACGYSSDDQNR
jgi:hypothetical protein